MSTNGDAGGNGYDDVTGPLGLGSGGGMGSNYNGGAGGGAIKLAVVGNLVVDGVITASGWNGVASHYYGAGGGGSGGSIWIVAGSLSGNGEVRANGGSGPTAYYGNGGGGAGGRIAIDVPASSNTFTGIAKAYGGTGTRIGGAGTVYWASEDRLVVNNNSQEGRQAVLLAGDYDFERIELRGKGHLRILGASSVVTLATGTLSGDGSGRLEVEGEIQVPVSYLITGATLVVLNGLTGPDDVSLQSGGGLELWAGAPGFPGGVYDFDTLVVGAGTTLRLAPYENGDTDYSNDYGVTLNLNDLTVASGGVITADGLGYGASRGPGEGGDISAAGGAGYGNLGGNGSGGVGAGSSYGYLYAPTGLGSGGGNGTGLGGAVVYGGAGAGALRVLVGDEIVLDGMITANGRNGNSGGAYGAGGGGSGGSIWIEAGSLNGTGVIQAKGGNGAGSTYGGTAGGGAGGRVAVYTDNLSSSILFSVPGGTGGYLGGVGTVYVDDVDPEDSSLEISPTTVVADLVDYATVTVTLLNSDGFPIPDKAIEVGLLSGGGMYVENHLVSSGQYVFIGYTNSAGVATASLKALTTGPRTIVARGGGQPIVQSASVIFVPGPVSPTQSTITANVNKVPADGATPATITVTALDTQGNPIPGVDVILSATGSAVVVQPASVTNAQGKASGAVTNTVAETVTISAVVDGVPLAGSVQVTFGSIDLSALLSGPSQAAAGGAYLYSVQVKNLSQNPAGDVGLSLTVPDGVDYLQDTAPVIPDQDGNSVSWELGDLPGNGQISFGVSVRADVSLPAGTVLNASLSVSSSTPDTNTGNNTGSVATTIVSGFAHTAVITPQNKTVSAGGMAEYTVQVTNTGLLADTYEISASGLDYAWVEIVPSTVSLSPGSRRDVILRLNIPDCLASQTIPFSVEVLSNNSGNQKTVNGEAVLDSAPQIWLDAPLANTVSGSTSVVFIWRTDPATTGLLTVYPEGQPDQAQTYATPEDSFHSVEVSGLTRNQTYQWTARAESTCGVRTSAVRRFTVGNGIVFVNRTQNITIDRDYDQRVNISVLNTDSLPHTLTTTVVNPYEDLIVNFVDSGSLDETITLQPGETRQVALAFHAQDVLAADYELAARLVADQQEAVSIYDNMVLKVHVLAEGNFTVQENETAYDPLTLARTFVITNHGKTITDLKVTAIDPMTGEPANIFLQPDMEHALLNTGDSIVVKAFPIFTAEDLGEQASTTGVRMASLTTGNPGGVNYTLQVSGAGNTYNHASSAACPSGKRIYAATMSNCIMSFQAKDWYCTNKPRVETSFNVPSFLNSDAIQAINIRMQFAPRSNVLPHAGQISFNGATVGSFLSAIPSGQYSFEVPTAAWNSALGGVVTQTVGINTQHSNHAHYVSSTDYELDVTIGQATTYVCADSQIGADLVVQQTYGCQSKMGYNWRTDVNERSVWNLAEIKALIAKIAKDFGYQISSVTCTQGDCADPINTRTGDFSFAIPDLSFPTSAGDLVFQRAYTTSAVDQYTELLGYGWTHNHDIRLIFPTDPGSMDGFVLLKDNLGNQHLFEIQEGGIFLPGPGVLASLSRSDGPPVTYTVLTPEQARLDFDAAGRIISRSDPQGRAFEYTYVDGKLVRVSADNGERFITLSYTGPRLESVADYSGRHVNFTYNAYGDLIASTDLLGRTWTYAYDSGHRMTNLIDPTGEATVTTEYDMNGRAYRQFDGEGKLVARLVYEPDGSITVYNADNEAQRYAYDDRNVLIENVDELGRGTDTGFSADFRPTSVTNAAGHALTMEWSPDGVNLLAQTDPAGGRTVYTYDVLNNLTSTTDASGNTTSYNYAGKLLTRTTDAANRTTTYTYSEDGFLESETDPAGRTTNYTYDAHGQRTSITDSLGNTTYFVYDELGRLVSTTDPRGRVTYNVYDDGGQLLSVTNNYDPDRDQNEDNLYNIVTTYTYDVRGNLIASTDTYDRVTRYEYDGANRLVRAIDSMGNISTNAYDAAGRLLSTTDALGRVTQNVYDAAGRRLSTIDALGNSSGTTTFDLQMNTATASDSLGHSATYYYDSMNRVVKVVDPLGQITTTSYDALGNVVARTDELGRTTRYEYDELNRLVRTIDPLGGVTATDYDSLGNRVASIDALGNRTTYTYDQETGRLIATTDPLGRATRTEFDAFGRRTASIDAAGERTTYEYDLLDRVVAVTDPDGNTTRVIYDALGNAIGHTDANGYTTWTTYDALNRPFKVTDPNGNVTINTYDPVGNLIAVTDALGHATTYTYDALNRRRVETDPLGNAIQYTYDVLGNLTDKRDPNGVVTHYVYDAVNRPLAVIQNFRPGLEATADTNVRTEFIYNAVGNRVTVKDPRGNETRFEYDDLNRVTKKIDPLGNTWEFTYDLAGNRTSMTDGNGVTTYFTYDAGRQLTMIDYPAPEPDVTFGYDQLGRRVSMADGLGVTTWEYDSTGRLTSVTDPQGSIVRYAYDANGNRTGLEYPDGRQVGYTYDAANRLTEVADWTGKITEYDYDPLGRLLTILRPNDVDTSYKYDAAGRLTQLENTSASGDLSTYGYTYDPAGNRTTAVEYLAGGSGATGPTVTVTLVDTAGTPLAGKPIYVFTGSNFTGYSKTTDSTGRAAISLPEGAYRFRADVDGTQFWSNAGDHCTVGICDSVLITVPQSVVIAVRDTDGTLQAGLSVYAFDGPTYTNFHGTTGEDGLLALRLPEGNYRFRADFNGTRFWSAPENDCSVPECTIASVTVTLPVTVSVLDELDIPQAGLPVYAYNGSSYTGYHGVTDENGQVTLTLPTGEYRFRTDLNGTQFWSEAANHCEVPGCRDAAIRVVRPLTVTVQDTGGSLKNGVKVYAFDGSTYSGYQGTTDADGKAYFTLPQGSYRFRADYNGTQFWSGAVNHCSVPGCPAVTITVTPSVLVTVQDTDGASQVGLSVYVFNGSTYTGFNGTTNADGQATFTLSPGSYRFRADLNGTQFWSDTTNHCTVPGCDQSLVVVTKPMMVAVHNTDGISQPDLKVYAFNGSTYTGFNGTTNADGQVIFTLPLGSYRFRADLNGTQFWSDTTNHCTLPGCEDVIVAVTKPVSVTVRDTVGTPLAGIKVYAFNGTTYTNYNKTTDSAGQAVFTLPQGSYRFRADISGSQYWSAAQNHCLLPGCENVVMDVGVQATSTSTQTATPTATATPSPNTTGTVTPNVSPTNEQTPATPGAMAPATTLAAVKIDGVRAKVFAAAVRPAKRAQQAPETVTVTVRDTDEAVLGGLKVYVFDGASYMGINATTNADGQVALALPQGSYRFRADYNGTQFWSSGENHCSVPGCSAAIVTVTIPVTVTMNDTNGAPRPGLKVYAFSGAAYTGYHATTDDNGRVTFTLPTGAYRFRADLGGAQFWSGTTDHCALPGCTSASVTVTVPVTVTVLDTDNSAMAGLSVYAFDGTTYTGFHGKTDEQGRVVFTLPQGSYRFRADFNGTQFWSGAASHCDLPGCAQASIAVTVPVVVTVASQAGGPYAGVMVYAFDGTTYTGYNGTTDIEGRVVFTLPQGSYRFRADYDGVHFWSGEQNGCSLPGCTSARVTIPGGLAAEVNVTIEYEYDPLQRLTAAVYSDGTAFRYAYDMTGNVLEYVRTADGLTVTTTYSYDAANQQVSAQASNTAGIWQYTYDGNGSLMMAAVGGIPSPGASRYTYNTAGFLVKVESHNSSGWQDQAQMSYDGLGNRQFMTAYADGQSVTTRYELDGGRVLTAAAGDLTTTYLYGLDPLAELTDSWAYSLPDGTHAPRQMTDAAGEVTLMVSYTPWGDTLHMNGTGNFTWGYFGGVMDTATGLLYVGNGQYYDPSTGRFLNRNAPGQGNPYVPWNGDPVGALFAPLALLAMVFSYRKKRSKLDNFIAILILGTALSISAMACNGKDEQKPEQVIVMVTSSPEQLVAEVWAGDELITTVEIPSPPSATPTFTCAYTLTPTPTPTPSIPSSTYFDVTLLSDVIYSTTGVSARMIYDHYQMLWRGMNNSPTDWWWDVYGRDEDGFSFWDYIALYLNHEAGYSNTNFAGVMSEAGVRFWYQRVREGYASPGEYGFIDWWASFSESTARDVKRMGFPPQNATSHQYQSFITAANRFKSPPISWQSGISLSRPYNWGNLSSILSHSRNSKVGVMLDANRLKYPIIYGYLPGGNPFYILSGCAQVNWIDNSDAHPDSAWNPNACDYLLRD